MSVTITSRPAAWVPTASPVVYKFNTTGGPYTNYRLQVEVFRSSDNASITNGVKFNFAPNPSGVTTVDIAVLLRNYLRKEYVTASSEDQIGSTRFYIKYQELYSGSATSVVSDSGNPSNAINGGLQILGSASYASYIPADSSKRFIYNRDILKLWRGYPFTINYLKSTSNYTLRKTVTDKNGGVTVVDTLLVSGTNNSLSKFSIVEGSTDAEIKFKFINPTGSYTPVTIDNEEFDTSLPNWVNTDVPSISTGSDVWDWQSDGGEGTAHAFLALSTGKTKLLVNDLPSTLTGNYRLTIRARIDSVLCAPLEMYFLVGSSWVSVGLFNVEYVTYFDYVSAPLSLGGATKIGLMASNDSGGSCGGGPGPGGGTDLNLWITSILLEEETVTDYTEEKTVLVLDPCPNPIYLFFKNSLNGDCYFMFDVTQDYTYTYDNGRKAKRLLLFTDNLTLSEWEELNDLFTPGEVFRKNVTEFTTSVDKTAFKLDQQVYEIKPDGSKIGVIVINKQNSTSTKKVKTAFSVEIEYPEYYI